MKMTTKLFALVAAVLVGGTAQAQEGGGSSSSEFFFQSAAGASNVTAGVDYGMLTTEPKGGGAETEMSGFGVRAEYEYGLNEMLSLGARLQYQSMTTEGIAGAADTDNDGLANPEIFLKGTSAMGTGRLRYGVTFGLGLENQTADNVSTGGHSLTPYVGYDMDMGGGILGARLSYGWMMERTFETAGGAEVKTEGGNMLGVSGFYEFMMADALLGAAVHFRDFADTENAAGASNNDAYSPLGLQIYSRIPVSTFVLLPSLAYDFSAGGDRYDSYNDMTLSVAARFGF